MTARSVLSPFQSALVAALAADAGLSALVTGVFDDVPEGQPFPYVSIGDATETPWDCFGEVGSEALVTVHVWSRAPGFREAQAITAALVGVLDNATSLAVAGYTLVALNVDASHQVRDPDGITRQLATQFRVYASAT